MSSAIEHTIETSPRIPHVNAGGRKTAFVTIFLILAAATAVIAPMFFLGNASGHDIQFHLSSWMDVAGQWHEGVIYPRWAEWANWGFGEPRFIFYPPASWMVGAALGSVLPWSLTPGAFIWLALVASGFSMWKLAREWLPASQATVAALFFEINPYHLAIVYYRSDFAELLAGVFFPLLLWAVLRLSASGPALKFSGGQKSASRWPAVPTLAMIFACVWVCNAPQAVIATYSLVLLFIVAAMLRRSMLPLASGAVAMAFGFGLAAFYILPAAYEQRFVQISQALVSNLHPAQNFIFTRATDPEFLLFNWKISTVALGMMLITAIAAVFAARKRTQLPELWWMLVTLGCAATLLMFRPSLPVWHYLPKLSFIQFPWRWMEPLALAFALFIAASLDLSPPRWRPWAIVGLLLAMTGGMASIVVKDAWWDSDDAPLIENLIATGHGYDGTDEYAPLGSNREELPGYTPDAGELPTAATPPIEEYNASSHTLTPAADVMLHIERLAAEHKIFDAVLSRPETLAIRLVEYPAWNVLVDGRPVNPGLTPETEQILLPLAPGAHRIRIDFRRTWDRAAGGIVSALSAVGLALFWYMKQLRSSSGKTT